MAADTLFGSVVAGRDPNSPALIVGSGGPSYTRSQVHDLAVQVARTLRASGVGPGDVVTLVDTNTVDFVVAFLGVTYSRAVVAPLNQNYTAVRSPTAEKHCCHLPTALQRCGTQYFLQHIQRSNF